MEAMIRFLKARSSRQTRLYVIPYLLDFVLNVCDSNALLLQDTVLWLHILLMTLAFGIIFPLGMVFGVRFPFPGYLLRMFLTSALLYRLYVPVGTSLSKSSVPSSLSSHTSWATDTRGASLPLTFTLTFRRLR